MDPWRNGSASDSRSEGCVFDSRRVQLFGFFPPIRNRFIVQVLLRLDPTQNKTRPKQLPTQRIDRKLSLSQAHLNQNWASVYDGQEVTKDPKILEHYLSFIISHTKPTHPLQGFGYKFSMSSFQVSHTCLSFDKPKVCGNWSLSCSHNVRISISHTKIPLIKVTTSF